MVEEQASVRVERDGPVFTVVLSRPAVRNAVDGPTAARLADAFRAFEADEDAAVAVLWGEGGTFCAGADLKAIGTERGNQVLASGDGPMGPTRMRLSKPVVAAVAGHAVAGAWSWRSGAICGSWRRTRSSVCSAAAGACR
ncbi:hypothetical protein GCM10020254_09030 [Streptomyces goshikiensis]